MANIHPLDLRMKIADLFDQGRFAGQTPLSEIASFTGAKPASLRRAILLLDFTTVKSRKRIMQPVAARYAPPRRWPALTKRHHPTVHAVQDLYASGRYSGRCYASDLAPLVNASFESVGRCLKTLRFKVVKRAHVVHVGWESAVVAPPREWPELFLRQRTLRQSQIKAETVMRITDAAAELAGVIGRAIRELDVADIPLDQRGQMKAQVKKVIASLYKQHNGAEADSISRDDLAAAVGASGIETKNQLLGKIQDMRRTALNEKAAQASPQIIKEEQEAWRAIASLDEEQMRNCINIVSRRMTTVDASSPASYALRWVRENIRVAAGERS